MIRVPFSLAPPPGGGLLFHRALATLGLIFLALSPAGTQESDEDLVLKLKGQAARPLTRSLTKPAPPKTETRSIVIRGRGIPKNIQTAEAAGSVSVKRVDPPSPTPAEATESQKAKKEGQEEAEEARYELTYSVDPESRVIRKSIHFQAGRTEFADAGSIIEIARLARAFKDPRLAGEIFVIEGHSSAEGEQDYNQRLSQQRADHIVDKLTELGTGTVQLLPVGFGETKAQHPENAPERLLAEDRRVEIYRLED